MSKSPRIVELDDNEIVEDTVIVNSDDVNEDTDVKDKDVVDDTSDTNESEPKNTDQAVTQRIRLSQEQVKIIREQHFNKKPVTIVLVMIVKNESKIIERLLDSCVGIIDYICITDTGSEDNTVELIEAYGERYNIPTTVHSSEFIDFGFNRTQSYDNARGTYPDATYGLLLDADMVLEIKESFDKQSLVLGNYHIYQRSLYTRYVNTRLIQMALSWTCKGVTHEYWDCPGSAIGRLHDLEIDDREDGGAKADKLTRDLRLLLKGISETKDRGLKVRYTFYLAQTYEGLGRHREAIHHFTTRSEMEDTFEEERWEALMRIARCYKAMEQYETASGFFHKAWIQRMHRAEPLYELAKMYRENENTNYNNLSVIHLKLAKQIPYPKSDGLFVDYHVYSWKIDYELSISCWYVESERDVGKEAIQRLWEKIEEIPQENHGLIVSNAKLYGFNYNINYISDEDKDDKEDGGVGV